MEYSTLSLLGLPPELRQQIYNYLLELPADLIIRSLFIRSGYRNVFMTQQRKEVHLEVLTICKQITTEALPLLYAVPLWKCGCRFEGLATQIGSNFGLIRRMEIDVDDLGIVSTMVGFNQQVRQGDGDEGGMDGLQVSLGVRWLSFDKLEELIVEGYNATALRAACSRSIRLEARRLCEQAERILQNHPSLRVLVEQQRRAGDDGGSDARDLSFGRVRWRFLRTAAAREDDEVVIDARVQAQLIERLQEAHAEVLEKSSLPRWMDNGEFSQYPYLVMQTQAEVAT